MFVEFLSYAQLRFQLWHLLPERTETGEGRSDKLQSGEVDSEGDENSDGNDSNEDVEAR